MPLVLNALNNWGPAILAGLESELHQVTDQGAEIHFAGENYRVKADTSAVGQDAVIVEPPNEPLRNWFVHAVARLYASKLEAASPASSETRITAHFPNGTSTDHPRTRNSFLP